MPDVNERIVQQLRDENSEDVVRLGVLAVSLSESNGVESVVEQLKGAVREILRADRDKE